MIVGKVVGSVVSTRKSDKLIGQKFMIVEPVHHMKTDLSQIVAIDIIGAGIGEYVLVAQGSAARIGCGEETFNHNEHFVVDESIFPSGVALHVQFAIDYLNDQATNT